MNEQEVLTALSTDRSWWVLGAALLGGMYGAFNNARRARAADKPIRTGTLATGFLSEASEWGLAMGVTQLAYSGDLPADVRPMMEPLAYIAWLNAILPKFY